MPTGTGMHMATADTTTATPRNSTPRFFSNPLPRTISPGPWANKDYLAAHIATIYSQDPAAMGQAFGETRREAGQKIRNPTLFSLNSDKRRTSPYSPIFGDFLNSGNTSLIGEPIDWE